MNTFEELVATGLGDWILIALRWPDRDTLGAHLLAPDGSREVEVFFHAISDLVVTMDFGVYVGRPLLFEVVVEPIRNGKRCELVFSAQPEGRIAFEYDRAVITKSSR
jgi:hypothetical protein